MLRDPRARALAVGAVLGLVAVALYFPADDAGGSLGFLLVLFAWTLSPFAVLALLAPAWSAATARGFAVVLAAPTVLLAIVVLATGDAFTLVYLWALPAVLLVVVLGARAARRTA